MVEDEVHEMVTRAVREAVDAEERGVLVRLDQGAIGWICQVSDWWPSEQANAAQTMIRSLRDPTAIPLLVALVTGARQMPPDCAQSLPYWCVEAATAIPGERTLAALLEVLTESSGNTTDLRAAVAEALGDRGDMHAIDGLRTTLTEIGSGQSDGEHRWLKVKTATALAKLGDAGGLAVAVDALGDEWAPVRWGAVQAIEVLRPPNAVELLSPLIHDPDVRHDAIRSLAEVGTPEAIDVLIPLADDPDRDVAELCVMTVAKLIGLRMDHNAEQLPDRAGLAAAWQQIRRTT
ncbi:HEAT repeat domain-containing protein [Streptomyces sp. NPDC058603]|uniref:HEAT repeat domain-containing protein n=1 Tax=Streptomyces sp. NPDC058603 TaxID=3346551 RepID=UPI00364DB19F